MSAASCGICLDILKNPVSTPCGHVHCEKCLFTHVESNSDAITATCPTCRAVFPIATPDLRFVPTKYHRFILPGVRRVFVDFSPESTKGLKATVKRLEERAKCLEQDKVLLMDRCEASMAASTKHAEGERDARIENEDLKRELQELRKKYEGLKGKYKDLKHSRELPSQAMKRTCSQASFDSSVSPNSGCPQLRPANFHDPVERPILRIPKRPRLLGSPFDPSKNYTTGTLARPFAFKKGRAPVLVSFDDLELPGDEAEHEDDFSITSSVGPQRSGMPIGDLFSPSSNRDMSDSSRGSIIFGMEGELVVEDD